MKRHLISELLPYSAFVGNGVIPLRGVGHMLVLGPTRAAKSTLLGAAVGTKPARPAAKARKRRISQEEL